MISIAYILGTTRSGTSAIRNALATSRYKGYGEGHLISILNGITQTVRHEASENNAAAVKGNGIAAIRQNVLIRNLFHGYEQYLVGEIGSRYLMDKTPNILPIASAPDLLSFHQSAKFIHCSRRHIDNLQSKRRKFVDMSFANQCNEWAECNRTWERVRPKLDEDSYVAFDYYDLVTDRESTCQRIGALLELDKDEVAKMITYLESERPQATDKSLELDNFLKLSEVDWSDEDKETFLRICGDVGEDMGYGMESYFA